MRQYLGVADSLKTNFQVEMGSLWSTCRFILLDHVVESFGHLIPLILMFCYLVSNTSLGTKVLVR